MKEKLIIMETKETVIVSLVNIAVKKMSTGIIPTGGVYH
jgi:hypothetical protein